MRLIVLGSGSSGKVLYIASGEPFDVGSMNFHPFTIPHDGVDTFAFTVESQGIKVGVVTDCGYITQLIAEQLRGSTLVMIESNYDRDMLKVGPYRGHNSTRSSPALN